MAVSLLIVPGRGLGVVGWFVPLAISPNDLDPGRRQKSIVDKKARVMRANGLVAWTLLDVEKRRNGTEGRTRTDKLLPAGDFESPVSTNSTTPAANGGV